jgi:hypothetical protein
MFGSHAAKSARAFSAIVARKLAPRPWLRPVACARADLDALAAI